MNKIVCRLNREDDFNLNDEFQFLDFTKKEEYHTTFYKSLTRLYKMPNAFKTEALDLLYISMAVYFADKRILRSNSYDNWTRIIEIYMPVLEIDKWNSEKSLLEEMVSFLSGDIWRFHFRKRNLNDVEKKIIRKTKTWYLNQKFKAEKFCMLSGGLDSYIGAIDLLEENKNIAFIGLYGGGKGVKPYQDKINSLLRNEYKLSKEQFFNFSATPLHGGEDSTRSRSLLFFAHAIILASCSNKTIDLHIPENGLISLNIPLTSTRLGSSSTRTTHPYYMNLLQKLLDNLNIEINLINPYQFKTKGEMIDNCKNKKFLCDTYDQTMSCSHPDQVRYAKMKKSYHCGTCLPCIIRRASILSVFNEDNSGYVDEEFKKGKAVNLLKSYKLSFLKFNSNGKNPFIIQIAGPIKKDYEDFENVYIRGMNELKQLLESINE